MISPVIGIVTGVILLVFSSLALTSSIEGIGSRLKFSETLTGALLSPFFTALPELIIVAEAIVLVGKAPGSEIAAGTIIGEPFMVSSIGIPAAVITLSLSGRRKKVEMIENSIPKIIMLLGLVFPVMLIPHFFTGSFVRFAVSIFLVVVYAISILLWKGKKEVEGKNMATNRILIFVVVGLSFLLLGSTLLVNSINEFSSQSGISRELMGILIIPVGTILPETMNSLIWASRLKTNLSISALLGEEMMFATIFPAIGISVSDWVLTGYGIAAILLFSVFSVLIAISLFLSRGRVYPLVIYFFSFIFFVLLLIFW
ncbi:MAG: hypothetical protein QXV40_01680 [Thermoplasmatales archaeon]